MGSNSEHDISMWKLRRLIKELDAASGAGTSMISLIIPAGGHISRVTSMLREEYGAAANIKSHLNRVSVQAAITSAIHRLTLYSRVLPHGLVLFVGTILTDEGKEKRILYDIEPPEPMHRSLYLCDSKFHTTALSELLETDKKYGFIIIDGNGCLFGSLFGNNREVLHKFSVDLPRKHGRGGQSALRFARLRQEKRHNYIRKVAEMAVQYFISGDGSVNVAGIVLAGSADFKTELRQSSFFDQRLTSKVIKVVDAIDLAADSLDNVKLIQEKHLIQQYFDEISKETGQFCFGIEDTIRALDLGAVETLIVWENLSILSPFRLEGDMGVGTLQAFACISLADQVQVEKSRGDQGEDPIPVNKPGNPGVESFTEKRSLLDWLVENHRCFGAKLEIVSDRSKEGSQFVKGFGGVGALLRYKVDFVGMMDEDEEFYDD